KDQENHADQKPAKSPKLILRNAFHAQEAEQIQPGHHEQDNPGGQETLPRQETPLQHLVQAGQKFQHSGEHDKAHHDFHAREPAAALGEALQVGRKERQQKERQREAVG